MLGKVKVEFSKVWGLESRQGRKSKEKDKKRFHSVYLLNRCTSGTRRSTRRLFRQPFEPATTTLTPRRRTATTGVGSTTALIPWLSAMPWGTTIQNFGFTILRCVVFHQFLSWHASMALSMIGLLGTISTLNNGPQQNVTQHNHTPYDDPQQNET